MQWFLSFRLAPESPSNEGLTVVAQVEVYAIIAGGRYRKSSTGERFG